MKKNHEINYISRDGFTLKYIIKGNGSHNILIIGSHLYYPRVFSSDLEKSATMVGCPE